MLALMAIHGGRPVPIDHMAAELWPSAPPSSAPTLIRGYILRLRRALGDLGGATIVTRPSGYELRCAADTTDIGRFEALTAQGRATLARGAVEEAHRCLSKALDLWRGEPYTDALLTSAVAAEASRLGERRLAAAEARVEAALLRGQGHEVIHELQSLTREHPLREVLWGQLMRAFHAADRRVDALEAYRRARRTLVEELGLEPGPDLRELHQAILDGRPVPVRGTPLPDRATPVHLRGPDVTVPASPPLETRRDVAAFTGRRDDLASLRRLVTEAGSPGAVVITGAAGVGKSALAIHLAHRLLGDFPDGQLHIDLRGSHESHRPLEPREALGRMLRALGTAPGAVPAEPAEAGARLRSLTAGRRMLVLLDNAADATQVEPLLPGEPCAVLVTGRRSLTTLGCPVHHLTTLPDEESLALLVGLIGRERLAADPAAARRLVRYCEGLPLALRIAAARLAARPQWPLRWLADRLESEPHRLDELRMEELSVRSALTVSLRDLERDPDGPELTRLLSLLAFPRLPHITVLHAAELADTSPARTERLLDKLLDTHLLHSPEPGLYRMPALTRLFAGERAARDPLSMPAS
ncbi:hypothetical protein GCM10022226_43050 [Sphaerisporangium flaviroseum]|uniref:Bacterial transcriptional activator domain-containing protein n=2 Tax=Sphaerisporangium flaviroseum TaxID=509199 RepID=A0ABP7IGQ4_9ACTN